MERRRILEQDSSAMQGRIKLRPWSCSSPSGLPPWLFEVRVISLQDVRLYIADVPTPTWGIARFLQGKQR
jgi:hypothetical protein